MLFMIIYIIVRLRAIFGLASLQICIGQYQPFGTCIIKIDVHPRVFTGTFKGHDCTFAEFCMANILAQIEWPVLPLES